MSASLVRSWGHCFDRQVGCCFEAAEAGQVVPGNGLFRLELLAGLVLVAFCLSGFVGFRWKHLRPRCVAVKGVRRTRRTWGFHRWPARWLGFLMLGFSWRTGEASVPGPSLASSEHGLDKVFRLGVCNANGVADKAHFFGDMHEDLWCISETHLTVVGRRTFGKMMQRHAPQYPSAVFGHDVLPRSEVSDIGRWSGVGVVSSWPTHRLPHDWSQALHSTGRLCVSTSFIHGHWISGCVVYGTPVGPTHGNAKHKTNCLLQAALARVLQLSGPRFIGGDFNHDHDSLEMVGVIRRLGFVDIQDLHTSRHGILPVATCRGKTRRDYLFVSPELASMFVSCVVKDWDWSDHSSLVAEFRCSSLDLERFPWPRPDPIEWAKFGDRPLSPVVSFAVTDDVSQTYADFWKNTEGQVQQIARRRGKPLPDRCFGRGQRRGPCRTTFQVTPLRAGRSGDLRPSFLGFSHVHRQWFRQLRRLESYGRLVRHGVHTWDSMDHCAQLWNSILGANGFRVDFAFWWVSQGYAAAYHCCVPLVPPDAVLANTLLLAFTEVVRDFEKHLLSQQRYKAKMSKASGLGALYKEVRRDPPEPVSLLVQSTIARVEAVDHDTVALEFADDTHWDGNTPLRHNGCDLQPLVVTADKVWCDTVTGVSAGDIVAQTRCIGKLRDIFEAFHAQWRVRWQKHESVEPSQWEQILAFADATLRPVASSSPVLSVGQLRALIKTKGRRSASGLDGVSVADLRALDTNQALGLLSLFTRAECDGTWPQQCLAGSVQSLAKVPNPQSPGDFRPVTVLSLVYRLWSSLHSRHWLKVLAPSLDADLCGNRPGHAPADIWKVVLHEVADAHSSDTLTCGFVVDLVKAYNTLPRYPVLYASKRLGIGQATLVGWSGALGQICRHFGVRNSFSSGLMSTTGLPEGCGLSCLGMLVLDLLLHRWMVALHPSIRTLTFVDNWEVILQSAEWLEASYERLGAFVDLLDLELDRKKTFFWSTCKAHRALLRSAGKPTQLTTKDLGAHIAYTKQLSNHYLTPRIQALDSFWDRLMNACGSHEQKIRRVLTAAWPRAFHACSAAVLGRRFMDVVRTKCLRALKLSKPGASPWLQYALEPDGVDPLMFVVWSTLRDYRSHRLATLAGGAELGPLASQSPYLPGSVSEILLQRIHCLGWRVRSDHELEDCFGVFHLRDVPLQELSFRAHWAWTSVVARQVSHRSSLQAFGQVDRQLTAEGLREFEDYDQGILRRHLNGTTITNSSTCYWSDTGDASCQFCGSLDSVAHRLWTCPASVQFREALPSVVLDFAHQFPEVLSLHGWTLASPLFGTWISALMALPSEVPPSISRLPCGGIVDLFVDGSCLWQDQPRYRLASWAVVLSAPLSFSHGFGQCSVLSAQPLSGVLQSSYRAELMALRVACCYAAEAQAHARVWTDCQSVLSRFLALTQGTKCLAPNSPHADLWTAILESVHGCLGGKVEVIKVPAHQALESAQDAFEDWIYTGNSAADEAARQANANRPPEFWQLWECHMKAVERNREIGQLVRHHIVRVARFWTTATEVPVQHEAVPILRRKRLPACEWHGRRLVQTECQSFKKIFGERFHQAITGWFDSVWDADTEVAWISFAQLYILYQQQCQDCGVVKVANRWLVVGEVDGFTPEQYRFSCLVKWFRLMIQALFKSAGFRVNTCTTRPRSSYLQCHVGCLAVPLKPELLEQVERWLSDALLRPIRGGGIHLELPRAF